MQIKQLVESLIEKYNSEQSKLVDPVQQYFKYLVENKIDLDIPKDKIEDVQFEIEQLFYQDDSNDLEMEGMESRSSVLSLTDQDIISNLEKIKEIVSPQKIKSIKSNISDSNYSSPYQSFNFNKNDSQPPKTVTSTVKSNIKKNSQDSVTQSTINYELKGSKQLKNKIKNKKFKSHEELRKEYIDWRYLADDDIEKTKLTLLFVSYCLSHPERDKKEEAIKILSELELERRKRLKEEDIDIISPAIKEMLSNKEYFNSDVIFTILIYAVNTSYGPSYFELISKYKEIFLSSEVKKKIEDFYNVNRIDQLKKDYNFDPESYKKGIIYLRNKGFEFNELFDLDLVENFGVDIFASVNDIAEVIKYIYKDDKDKLIEHVKNFIEKHGVTNDRNSNNFKYIESICENFSIEQLIKLLDIDQNNSSFISMVLKKIEKKDTNKEKNHWSQIMFERYEKYNTSINDSYLVINFALKLDKIIRDQGQNKEMNSYGDFLKLDSSEHSEHNNLIKNLTADLNKLNFKVIKINENKRLIIEEMRDRFNKSIDIEKKNETSEIKNGNDLPKINIPTYVFENNEKVDLKTAFSLPQQEREDYVLKVIQAGDFRSGFFSISKFKTEKAKIEWLEKSELNNEQVKNILFKLYENKDNNWDDFDFFRNYVLDKGIWLHFVNEENILKTITVLGSLNFNSVEKLITAEKNREDENNKKRELMNKVNDSTLKDIVNKYLSKKGSLTDLYNLFKICSRDQKTIIGRILFDDSSSYWMDLWKNVSREYFNQDDHHQKIDPLYKLLKEYLVNIDQYNSNFLSVLFSEIEKSHSVNSSYYEGHALFNLVTNILNDDHFINSINPESFGVLNVLLRQKPTSFLINFWAKLSDPAKKTFMKLEDENGVFWRDLDGKIKNIKEEREKISQSNVKSIKKDILNSKNVHTGPVDLSNSPSMGDFIEESKKTEIDHIKKQAEERIPHIINAVNDEDFNRAMKLSTRALVKNKEKDDVFENHLREKLITNENCPEQLKNRLNENKDYSVQVILESLSMAAEIEKNASIIIVAFEDGNYERAIENSFRFTDQGTEDTTFSNELRKKLIAHQDCPPILKQELESNTNDTVKVVIEKYKTAKTFKEELTKYLNEIIQYMDDRKISDQNPKYKAMVALRDEAKNLQGNSSAIITSCETILKAAWIVGMQKVSKSKNKIKESNPSGFLEAFDAFFRGEDEKSISERTRTGVKMARILNGNPKYPFLREKVSAYGGSKKDQQKPNPRWYATAAYGLTHTTQNLVAMEKALSVMLSEPQKEQLTKDLEKLKEQNKNSVSNVMECCRKYLTAGSTIFYNKEQKEQKKYELRSGNGSH